MPLITVIHRPSKKPGRRCDYPLARLRVPEGHDLHAAAWKYQRERFGVPDAPLCGGCKKPVGNQIAFFLEKGKEPSRFVTRDPSGLVRPLEVEVEEADAG